MDFIEMYSKKQIWVNSQWELGNSKTENATKQDKSDLKWFWLTSGLFLDGYVLVGKFWKKKPTLVYPTSFAMSDILLC